MKIRGSTASTLATALLVAGLPGQGAKDRQGGQPPPDRGGDPPRVGTYETGFPKTHPLGSLPEITARMGFQKGEMKRHDPDLGYEIAKERFFVHVPEGYTDDGSFGLLVWISPAPQGNCAVDWPAALAKHKLIHIGAHSSGNDRFVWYRIALALDAVHNMKERYRLDPDRIYVFGHSGGGRTASTLAMLWPDVFAGGIYANGTNHFRKIRKPGQEFYWPAKFPRPTGKRWDLARRKSRHVFVHGAEDFNLVHARLVQQDLSRRDRFAHTTLLSMPGKGHEPPDAEWLGKCIEALDGPRSKAGTRPAK